MTKVYIYPQFSGVDQGDGGVRRVVEAQHRHLPALGITLVDDPAQADVLAAHIAADERLLHDYPDKPLVAHSHGLYWAEYDWEKWAYKANTACMETIRQADAITAPTLWVANAIRRGTMRRVAVVGHGVDLEDWPVGSPQGYVLWNKTRIDAVCDPEALDHLARLAPDVPFVSTYSAAKLPNIKLTGKLPYEEGRALIQEASVYLCTARETFGIGTLEAMAAGVPVLGWAWGGQVDIVNHQKTGYLATPGDFDDLLAGLRYCLKHQARMGKAARETVEKRYQWSQAVLPYADIYQRVHQRHQAAAAGPRVSIVVPAYNLEAYLPATLDSVLAQTSDDWECIVVDDASPDRCGTIAHEYALRDERFRVIHNSTNQYLAGALNTGISAANGRYILPLDADNLITPQTLQLLAGALDKDRSLHIAYGRVQFVTPDGAPDQSVGDGGHSGWPMEFRGEWQLRRRRNDGGPSNLVPSTALFRRGVWEDTGGYRRRFRTGEDADFWTRAASFGYRPGMVTQADTLIYRNRPASMSRVEDQRDWTGWMPWCGDASPMPSGAILDEQPPVQSYDPPAATVVIPVGPGHEHLLTDALDSVAAQTFVRWECIVVNDSGTHLEGLPSWVQLIDHGGPPGHLGVAAARNLAIAAAKAPLFVPLDADDTLEAFFLELTLPVQKEFGGYVYTDWHKLWADGELMVWETKEYDARLLVTKGCLHAVTGLYPVAAWQQVGGYDPELTAWEDWDFQLKLADAGICGTRYPQPLFTYRMDTGQRRDDNYANFDASKAGIRDKWGAYFNGGKELMGCRSCSGGKGHVAVAPAMHQRQDAPMPQDGQYVLVEYIGRSEGAAIYRGPGTGNQYRFANLEGERVKYVAVADADHFGHLADFRVTLPDPPQQGQAVAEPVAVAAAPAPVGASTTDDPDDDPPAAPAVTPRSRKRS